MFSCRFGSLFRGVSAVVLWFAISAQAQSVFGQDPPFENATESDGLAYSTLEFPVAREGYLSLQWSSFPGASGYQVIEVSTSRALYEGEVQQAFISGLEDGVYEFRLEALGADGSVIAVADQVARVEVEHFSLTQALILFSIGLVVFLGIVGVICWGVFSTAGQLPVAPQDGQGDAEEPSVASEESHR